MSGDLVDLHGGLSKVLRRFPNGGSTSTLRTFNSLANLLALCRHGETPGCLRLVVGATPEGDGPIARDTFAAAAMIARNPARLARPDLPPLARRPAPLHPRR